MKPLSHLALNIRPSTTLAIDAMFKQSGLTSKPLTAKAYWKS